MQYKVKDVSFYGDSSLMWNHVVDKTCYAWFWSTYRMYQFRLKVLKESKKFIDDKSFFVFADGTLIGLFPLTLRIGGDGSLTYACYDDSLPFPMVIDNYENRESALEFMFNHFESIVKENSIDYISLKFSPPESDLDNSRMSKKLAVKMNFLCNSLDFHSLVISEKTLSSVRTSYRYEVKKYSNNYSVSILNKEQFYEGLVKQYMDLHVKDSGHAHRPLITYKKQLDLILDGEAFLVQAKHKENNIIVGMMIISIYKGAGYYGSVAVDPSYKKESISHIMQWDAIKYLNSICYGRYEMGEIFDAASFEDIPSEKLLSISFFKSGWSRGNCKRALIFQKFFSNNALNYLMDTKREELKHFFNL